MSFEAVSFSIFDHIVLVFACPASAQEEYLGHTHSHLFFLDKSPFVLSVTDGRKEIKKNRD